MLAAPVLFLLLAAADDNRAVVGGARAELEICAARIEHLKARGTGGAELDRLLRRAQELAAVLERTEEPDSPPRAVAPYPEELRERADAARDEADRLAAEIAAVDVRLGDLRRGRGEPLGVERAALGTPATPPSDRLRALHAERAALSEKRAHALAEAARLDAEARAAEFEP